MIKKSGNISKLGLGTVQFGLNYGISNSEGMVSSSEVTNILNTAHEAGITLLDTAAAYGNSEQVLGNCTNANLQFQIVTKTPAFENDILTAESGRDVIKSFDNSLEHLKRDALYGLLLHNADDLSKIRSDYLIDALKELKEKKKVRKIGVSVYSDRQIDQVLKMFIPDIVQLPLNLFDQRLIKSGHLSELKRHGVEIHTRSTFLQGLMFMNPDNIDPFFDPIRNHLLEFHKELGKNKMSPVQAALKFCLNQEDVDKVIVGVCSHQELKEICDAVSRPTPEDFDYNRWQIDNSDILNPSKWNLQKVEVEEVN